MTTPNARLLDAMLNFLHTLDVLITLLMEELGFVAFTFLLFLFLIFSPLIIPTIALAVLSYFLWRGLKYATTRLGKRLKARISA
jgi:uncharacterized membrane protein YdfJ with MMPL/SSD domain